MTSLHLPELPASDGLLPTSEKRFAGGASYRIEIPSVEGVAGLEAVLDEAERLRVPVHRCSQGSGVLTQTDAELDELAAIAAAHRVELSLFARPTAAWTLSLASMPGGPMPGVCRGAREIAAATADAERGARHGIRSVLVSDIGLLWRLGAMRVEGALPADLRLKASVLLPVANPLTARLAVELGADTLNAATDLSLADLADLRAVTDAPLDVYVEAPDDLGGYVRLHEIAEIVRVAAPVYLKFGLRNATAVYPSGLHLERVAAVQCREKVRRARVALDLLADAGIAPPAPTDAASLPDLGVPVTSGARA